MGRTFVDFEITELIPNKKVVWKVTDCHLPWLKNKKKWNNTEVVLFLIGAKKEQTKSVFSLHREWRVFQTVLTWSVLLKPMYLTEMFWIEKAIV
jgi:hypothetical protein